MKKRIIIFLLCFIHVGHAAETYETPRLKANKALEALVKLSIKDASIFEHFNFQNYELVQAVDDENLFYAGPCEINIQKYDYQCYYFVGYGSPGGEHSGGCETSYNGVFVVAKGFWKAKRPIVSQGICFDKF